MADFGGDDFLEPLDVLLPALEHEADLTVIGRWMTRRFLLRFLEVRLQLTEYVRRDPGVVDEEIVAPWFVTGAPRTGTTILHAMLAQDPASRVPEGWELLRPVPPPSPDPDGVRRRRPHPARRPRAAPARPGGRRARRHPRVPRPHAQGVPVGDVVRVPVGGVHRALPRAVVRRVVRALRPAAGVRHAPTRAAGAATARRATCTGC